MRDIEKGIRVVCLQTLLLLVDTRPGDLPETSQNLIRALALDQGNFELQAKCKYLYSQYCIWPELNRALRALAAPCVTITPQMHFAIKTKCK